MKKSVIVISLLFISTSVVYSYPAFDLSAGSMPFQLMQQQTFQKTEIDTYRQFKDAYDNPVEQRNATPEEIQAEYEEIQNLRQPTKIMLGQPKKSTEMKLIQDDGHIKIKHSPEN